MDAVNEFANNSALSKIFTENNSYGVDGLMSIWGNTVDFAHNLNDTLNDPYWTNEEKLGIIVVDSIVHTGINAFEAGANIFVDYVSVSTGVLIAGTASSSGNIIGGAFFGTVITLELSRIGTYATSISADWAHTAWDGFTEGWFRD